MSMGGLGNGQVTLTTLGIDPDVVTEVLETVGAGAPPSTVAFNIDVSIIDGFDAEEVRVLTRHLTMMVPVMKV
jgi:hypothetical protein